MRFGNENLSHLVLKKDGRVVAAAQAIIKKVPVLNAGIAYVYWGPLWHARNVQDDTEVFSQILRALHNEYVSRRGLVLRLLPILFNDDLEVFSTILNHEGFKGLPHGRRQRTLIIDLSPSLNNLRKGLDQKWRNCLNRAEKNGMVLVEGEDDGLFEMFVNIYREMHIRKNFVTTSDIYEFRLIQKELSNESKMKIMVCLQNGEPVAGAIFSTMGATGIYLFGATSNSGRNSNGSYLIQWKIIERLKKENCSYYDLHGIDPETNPGTYKFKAGLCGINGRDVRFLGQFEAQGSFLSNFSVKWGEALKTWQKKTKIIMNRVDFRKEGACKPQI